MRKRPIYVPLVVCALAALVGGSYALANGDDGKKSFKSTLNGYNEVVGGPATGSTGSVSTLARGEFRAKLTNNDTRLEWTLTYRGIEGGTVTAAHPHFAQQHVGGSIFGFFCGGPKPACPQSGTVTGTWTASDISGPADQGVEPGSFAEFVRALRAGAVYVNVHSSPRFPEGEIRGQVGNSKDD